MIFSFGNIAFAQQFDGGVPGVASGNSNGGVPGVTSDDYSAPVRHLVQYEPYVAMFEQYINETGIEAEIADFDLFYATCKDLSLSEWKEELDNTFAKFKSISENNEPIVTVLEGDIDNSGTPSVKRGGFSDTLTGYYQTTFRYKFTVSGTLAWEVNQNVFSNVSWQAWNFPGYDYYHVESFKSTNNHTSASTETTGYLMMASGLSLTAVKKMTITFYARNYN